MMFRSGLVAVAIALAPFVDARGMSVNPPPPVRDAVVPQWGQVCWAFRVVSIHSRNYLSVVESDIPGPLVRTLLLQLFLCEIQRLP